MHKSSVAVALGFTALLNVSRVVASETVSQELTLADLMQIEVTSASR